MKKLLKSILIIMIICTLTASLTACKSNKRMPGLTSQESVSSTGVIDTSNDIVVEGPAFEGSYSAPKFKDGSYTLVSQTAQDTVLDSNGSTLTGLARTYYYSLDVKANSDGSAKIKYTFDRIIISYAQLGADTVTADTENDCPDYYKELIGKSFTATIGADGNFASISGVAEILAANSKFSEKLGISEESLISVVKDTFYSLPATIDGETSFTISHGDGDSTVSVNYRAALYKDDRIAFSFKEQTNGLPQSLVGAATITNYKSYEPASGTLWISLKDRALVEYSSYSKVSYSMEYEKETIDVTVTSSGSSKITAK